MLQGLPAFILGNGPYLPVDDLDCLAERFTVGVNRIVTARLPDGRSFVPTVVMWVDRSVYRDVGERIDRCGGLLVCDRSVKHRQTHVGLKTWTGEQALTRPAGPDVLCCNGNTGCCAARWAIALGCEPVYLVGMEAKYRDGKTDFYVQIHGTACPTGASVGTLQVIRAELDRLLRDFPGRTLAVPDGTLLREVAGRGSRVDQARLREHIKTLLRDRGVEVG